MPEKLYNTETLIETHHADKEFIKYMIELFIKNIPETSANLENASKESNWEKVYFSAHKMKASIDLFNLTPLKDLIRVVEKKAKHENQTDTIAKDVNYISNYIKECVTDMRSDFKIA